MNSHSSKRRHDRPGMIMAFAGIMAIMMTGIADARPGGTKGSIGSRGSRTYSAPPTTQTAPSAAQPIQRSQTTPSQAQAGQHSATAQAAQPARSRFGGGFFAGLLGAGLLGALFGAGLFGGLGSLASILGFVLQIALIGGLVYFAVQFFRRRQQPAAAGAGADRPLQRTSFADPTSSMDNARSAGGAASTMGAATYSKEHAPTETIIIGPEDYASFERALHEIQMAYSQEDVAALWSLATPEMAGYFQEELNDNARKGVRNVIADVKLLQGDLSEAWREGPADYATVALRFALAERMIDRMTGQVLSGEPTNPEEATEIWTFRRASGEPWKLSAIQQTA